MKTILKITLVSAFVSLIISSCGSSGSGEMVANLENGKVIYNKACIACHWKGVAGAAALEDKPRWEEIAAKGMTVLLEHSIKGYTGKFGVMPEKGTCLDCSEQDMYDAISFMMGEAGVTASK
ncbi:MAG: c-type cytochrome [Bacteroidales bacterium]|jgi:cytochrome c5|nr:c-type cytochrome [Bacteroidales bacterium]